REELERDIGEALRHFLGGRVAALEQLEPRIGERLRELARDARRRERVAPSPDDERRRAHAREPRFDGPRVAQRFERGHGGLARGRRVERFEQTLHPFFGWLADRKNVTSEMPRERPLPIELLERRRAD